MIVNRRRFLATTAVGAATAFAMPSVLRAQESRAFRLGITTPPGHPWNNAR